MTGVPEAIGALRINRQQLVAAYVELNAMGGTWKPECKHGKGAGALGVRFGIVDMSADGKFAGVGIVRDRQPYAPFRDFRLLDPSGNPAVPGTPAFTIQQKMAHLMNEIRRSALILSELLPQLATVAPNLEIDPTPLTQLRHRLPPFPYVPVREQTMVGDFQMADGSPVDGPVTIKTDGAPDFTPAVRDKALADDEPFFAAARVTLEHLAQAYHRTRQVGAEPVERREDTGKAPDADRLLNRDEWAKNVSPLLRPSDYNGRMPDSDATRTFVSYTHDSEQHKSRVLALCDRLRDSGVDANLDQYEHSPSVGWPRWMNQQVAEAKFVLVVCTKTYRERFENPRVEGKGKGAKWEGGVILQELYDSEAHNTKFIPILFESGDETFVPGPLRSATHYDLSRTDGFDLLYRHLTSQPLIPRPPLGTLRPMPPRSRQPDFALPGAPTEPVPDSQVGRKRSLPVWLAWITGTGSLLGLGTYFQTAPRVPELIDRRLRDAKDAATRAGLRPVVTTRPASTQSAGLVLGQDPKPGTRFQPGTTIELLVAAPAPFVEPQVRILQAGVGMCAQSGVSLIVELEVANPNPVEFEVVSVSGHLRLVDLQAGQDDHASFPISRDSGAVVVPGGRSLVRLELLLSSDQFLDAIRRIKFPSARQKPGFLFQGKLGWRSLDQSMPEISLMDWAEQDITPTVASPMSLATDNFLRELAQLFHPEDNYTRDPNK